MSYEITLILTPKFIKDTTSVHSNVDDNLLVPIIQDCQRLFVERILGSALYDEILTQVKAKTLTDLNKTLINDHLALAMQRYITAKYLRQGSYKITNKGTVNMNGDNASLTSKGELIEQAQDFMNRAEEYAQRTTLFLMENEDDYPLYCDNNDAIDDIQARGNNYFTGFYLGPD